MKHETMVVVIAPFLSRTIELGKSGSEAGAVDQCSRMRARPPCHVREEPPEKTFRFHDVPWFQRVFMVSKEPSFFRCQMSSEALPNFCEDQVAIAISDDSYIASACDRVRSLINQKAGLVWKPRCSLPSLHIKKIGDVT